jgi:hypothetical protein
VQASNVSRALPCGKVVSQAVDYQIRPDSGGSSLAFMPEMNRPSWYNARRPGHLLATDAGSNQTQRGLDAPGMTEQRITFRFRLYPTKQQVALFEQTLGLCSELYNARVVVR